MSCLDVFRMNDCYGNILFECEESANWFEGAIIMSKNN